MEKLAQYALGLKTYFFKDTLANQNFLAKVGTFETGVMTGDKLGLINTAGYDEGVKAGCRPEWTSHSWGSELTWNLENIGIYKEYCFDNLAAEMKRNQQLYKLQSNDAFLKIVRDFMSNAIANSAVLNAFFGDKSSVNSKLQLVDGVFKQVAAFVTADGNRRTHIVDGSNADDNSAFETAGNAIKFMRKLVTDAKPELRMAADKEIIMTQKTWDALATDMMVNKGIYIQQQWTELLGGFKATEWDGITVIVAPSFDVIAASVANNALAATPYYALLTTKSNLRFGSMNNEQAGISKVDINDDVRTQTTLVNAVYSLGVIVPQGEMVQVMY